MDFWHRSIWIIFKMGLLGTEIKPRSPSLVVIGICLCWLLRGFKGTTNLYTLVVCYVMYYDLSAAFVPSYVGGIFNLVQTTCFLQSFNSIFKGHLKGLGGHYIQKPGEDSNLRLLSDKLSSATEGLLILSIALHIPMKNIPMNIHYIHIPMKNILLGGNKEYVMQLTKSITLQ